MSASSSRSVMSFASFWMNSARVRSRRSSWAPRCSSSRSFSCRVWPSVSTWRERAAVELSGAAGEAVHLGAVAVDARPEVLALPLELGELAPVRGRLGGGAGGGRAGAVGVALERALLAPGLAQGRLRLAEPALVGRDERLELVALAEQRLALLRERLGLPLQRPRPPRPGPGSARRSARALAPPPRPRPRRPAPRSRARAPSTRARRGAPRPRRCGRGRSRGGRRARRGGRTARPPRP